MNVLDYAVDLIYQLLNEYDIGLWRDIEYIELAELWVSLIENDVLEEKEIKTKIKEYIISKIDYQEYKKWELSIGVETPNAYGIAKENALWIL